jgi:hypothetical protein
MPAPGLIRPQVKLTGEDGNAFAVLGRMREALTDAGNDPEVIAAFMKEATSGDYDHLLRTCIEWADVS